MSWQGSSETGTTLSHEAIKCFMRETHEVATRSGCIDMNLLSVSGNIIAFAYNYIFNGQVNGLRVGYDPEYSKLGPGNSLYALAIEDSFARGDQVYDLGPGSLECKRHWHSRIEPVVQYTYYEPRSVRAQLMKWKGRLADARDGSPSSADEPVASEA